MVGREWFKTEKGSVYFLLDDGRTQRHNYRTGQPDNPQDGIVFVPTYEALKKLCGDQRSMEPLGENQVQMDQIISSYIQGNFQGIRVKSNAHVINQTGGKLDTNEQIRQAGEVYLYLSAPNEVPIMLPVSKGIRIGYEPFDQRRFIEDGDHKREKHLGHEVTEVFL